MDAAHVGRSAPSPARDLNGDGANTDYVPGTTASQGNREPRFLGLVNAWRASNGLAAISADQIDSNNYNRIDVRVSKAFELGGAAGWR